MGEGTEFVAITGADTAWEVGVNGRNLDDALLQSAVGNVFGKAFTPAAKILAKGGQKAGRWLGDNYEWNPNFLYGTRPLSTLGGVPPPFRRRVHSVAEDAQARANYDAIFSPKDASPHVPLPGERDFVGPVAPGTLAREPKHAVLGSRIPGGIPEDHTPHHLIGIKEAEDFAVMQRAAELGYDVNRGNNLIPFPNTEELAEELNLPYHPGNGRHRSDTYVNPVRERLDNLQQRYDAGQVDDADLIGEIRKIEDSIRTDLINGKLRLNSRYPWYPK